MGARVPAVLRPPCLSLQLTEGRPLSQGPLPGQSSPHSPPQKGRPCQRLFQSLCLQMPPGAQSSRTLRPRARLPGLSQPICPMLPPPALTPCSL